MSEMRTIPFGYDDATKIIWDKLGESAIMQIAAYDGTISIRTISAIMYDDSIWFKTDVNFPKTKQLLENPECALAMYNIFVNGVAHNRGKVVDEPDRKFEKLYKEYHDGSYHAYAHEDTEILIEVVPTSMSGWDTDENNYAFEIQIDCENKKAVKMVYDEYDEK